MKITFFILIILHGLIHLLGLVKAFKPYSVTHLTQPITKKRGILWFGTSLLFVASALLFLFEVEGWWIVTALGLTLSQYLIIGTWKDAKAGTLANAIILLLTIIGFSTWNFHHQFKNEVIKKLYQSTSSADSILTENDIQFLPVLIQKYIRYTGAIEKPKVKNFTVAFSGRIRKDERSEWMLFTSTQYNFLDSSTRLFFMNATMKHLPVAGFHSFKNGNAFMDIRLFSMVNVQYQSGKEMGIAETVTFFNDMCCMAPATLIDKRISWLEADRSKVKASFINNDITISAWLYFNDKGELINFISDDRYATTENNTLEKTRWSTPLKDYIEINGHKVASYADVIYHYPSGDLCYGNFSVTNIDYNVKKYTP